MCVLLLKRATIYLTQRRLDWPPKPDQIRRFGRDDPSGQAGDRRRRQLRACVVELSASSPAAPAGLEGGMPDQNQTVGQALQNWLIRNRMDIYHPLFVDAVDHAFDNELRAYESRRSSNSATTASSRSSAPEAALSTA